MSTQHTPGPWNVSNTSNCIWRAGQGRICIPPNIAQSGNWKANANLIAAAPDMYEALKSIVEDHEFCGDDWGDRRDAWIETARAVLAKVEVKS